MDAYSLSTRTLKRLPVYLNYLKSVDPEETPNISATTLAKALDLNDVLVRKDLAQVSSGGKPKVGYEILALIEDLESALGYGNVEGAVLVGAGKLGRAILSYNGFDAYGVNILAAFDNDTNILGEMENGKPIIPLEKMESVCGRLGVQIGIITVPAQYAQEICDRMVDCGIQAIWNFAPAHLTVPEHILVRDENMASSLALLSNHLRRQENQ